MALQRLSQGSLEGPAEDGPISCPQFGPQINNLDCWQIQVADFLVSGRHLSESRLGWIYGVTRLLLLHLDPVAHYPLGKAQKSESTAQSPIVCAQVGRSAPKNDCCPFQPGALQGHLSRVIARGALLFVGRLVFLVHDDAAQPRQGCKER